MSRQERKALQSIMRKQAAAWPPELVRVPESEWPQREPKDRPLSVWRSRGFLVQIYNAPPFGDVAVHRLSACRVTIQADGKWDAEIGWEELQNLKLQAGYGGWYGVEIYPRGCDLVNIANMRHLWLMAEPLAIGWFSA